MKHAGAVHRQPARLPDTQGIEHNRLVIVTKLGDERPQLLPGRHRARDVDGELPAIRPVLLWNPDAAHQCHGGVEIEAVGGELSIEIGCVAVLARCPCDTSGNGAAIDVGLEIVDGDAIGAKMHVAGDMQRLLLLRRCVGAPQQPRGKAAGIGGIDLEHALEAVVDIGRCIVRMAR